MQHVNQITNAIASGNHIQPEVIQAKPEANISEDAAKVVNALFKELRAIYPAWKQAFPDDTSYSHAKVCWTKAFIENGIHSLEQIRMGVKRARTSEKPFWPSVGEFMALCKPSDKELGIPDFEQAWLEASNTNPLSKTKWTSGLTYQAAKDTSFYLIRNESGAKSKPIFKKHFERLAAEVRNGGDIPALPVPKTHRIEQQPTKALPKEVQLSHLDQLRKAHGL